jgi:Pyridoxamine 5'-phosphate oxidase
MATWGEFAAAMPEMAAAGSALLYQYGPGLAYLATVRPDGSPRLHPICPVIVDGGLYAFIGDSPKRRDLLRDGRYALHTFPKRDGDDEFYVSGRVVRVEDSALVAKVDAFYRGQGTTHGDDDLPVEFLIERAMHAAYKAQGAAGWPPTYTRWRAPKW